MIVTAIKTHRISAGTSLEELLDKYIQSVPENSVLAVTSKVVAMCEGRVVPIGNTPKLELITQEADYYISPSNASYGVALTIKNNLLIADAGIDESNSGGNYVLWPQNPDECAAKIRAYLMKRDGIKKIGVIITDSVVTPMQYGTTGIAIGYAGLRACHDYVGQPDLWDRPARYSRSNVINGLAAAAVLEMGEGAESTPLALITDISLVEFVDDLTDDRSRINPEDDLYREVLKRAPWQTKK